ncbi:MULTISPECIES: hypothetical protein [unclassified Modestobacter]
MSQPVLWIPDTSSLITLAVDGGLAAAVQAECRRERVVLLDIVVDELTHLADGREQVSGLAAAALTQLAWLGSPLYTSDKVDSRGVQAIQDVIRAGRPLRDPWQHLGEAVALALAERLQVVTPKLLTEDHDARVEAKNRGLTALSVHKLLSAMVGSGRLNAETAEGFADHIHAAGRAASQYSADEFRTGDLGRVGKP